MPRRPCRAEIRSRPTALIGLDTHCFRKHCKSRASGRRIPENLSVVDIGTEDAFALMHPALTTLRFDIDGAAEAALGPRHVKPRWSW
jgi:LacI family transcriptional regulator